MSEHSHAHTIDASSAANRRRLKLAFGITASVLVAQFVGAILTGSLALLVDTGHMLTDVGGLALALVAATLALRPPSAKRTWGYQRAEVISAGVQAGILLAVGVFAAIEGIRRLFEPPEVEGPLLLVFGIIGLAANVVAIAILASSRGENLNMRAAFLEVLNDALGSVAVIVSAIVIWTTGWARADAIAALVVSALIVPRAIMLLREAGGILLESTPKGLDLDEVRKHILELEHVTDVHDLHASQIATGLPVLTAHVVVDDSCFHDGHAADMLAAVQACVAEHFPVAIEHATIQLEPASHQEHGTHA